MPATATYVYCIVHQGSRLRVTRVPSGLGGATAPRIVDLEKGLWMVCADVPLRSYGEERIEEGLRDLEWVARIAVAHEAVVERFARVNGATVIPMKLFTIFSNDERAREEMHRRRRDLDAILKRIKGCQEWGVRVTRSRRAVAAPTAKAPDSGAAFLAGKKRARDLAREQLMQSVEAADDTYRTLAKIAKEIRRREPPEAATSPPMLDAAFLVPTLRRIRFKAAAAKAAAKCGAAGAELVLTGPWPAYHFVHDGEPAT